MPLQQVFFRSRASTLRLLAFSFAAFVTLLAGCRTREPGIRGDLLISGVRLVAMSDEAVASGQSVLVAGDEISWVGPASEEGRIGAARRVEGNGMFLVPGLIDMHAHIQDPRDLTVFLRHGVTTIASLSGDASTLALREGVRDGSVVGPQIFTSGAILDGDPGRGDGNVPLADAAAARDAVTAQIAAGYDFVKIYDLIEEEAYRAAVETAHAAGKPVFGHIPKPLGLEGVIGRHDVVAHAEEYYYTFFHDTNDRSRLGEAARLTAEAGLAVIPNTGFFGTIIEQAEDLESFLARDEIRYVAPGTLADWLPETNRYLGREPAWLENLRRMDPFLHELTRELHRAGVPLFAGSDAGAIGGIPGVSLRREIGELHASGLTRYEALAAATRVPGEWLSEHLGAAPRGRIAVGQRADLLLLEADPLEDLAALASALAVVAAGRWHDVSALEERIRAGSPPAGELLAWYREVRTLVAASDFAALEERLATGPSDAFAEKLLNALGYRALYLDHDAGAAVRIFELNSRSFPASANVWDSLGEGLAERGEVAAAIASYEKALALDPGNDNAKRRIAGLRER